MREVVSRVCEGRGGEEGELSTGWAIAGKVGRCLFGTVEAAGGVVRWEVVVLMESCGGGVFGRAGTVTRVVVHTVVAMAVAGFTLGDEKGGRVRWRWCGGGVISMAQGPVHLHSCRACRQSGGVVSGVKQLEHKNARRQTASGMQGRGKCSAVQRGEVK